MRKKLSKDLFLDGIELPTYPKGTNIKVLEVKLNPNYASGKVATVELPNGKVKKICESFIE